MGAFFVNHHVRTDSADKVVNAMHELGAESAYVSPSKDGWVTVYDHKCDEGDMEEIERVGQELSRSLKASVVAFLVHDSDVLFYWIYRNGELADQYCSLPDYFGEDIPEDELQRLAGQPDVLASVCLSGTTPHAVEAIMRSGDDALAEELVTKLADLLGIDGDRCVLGFNYLVNDGASTLPDIAQLQPVGTARPLTP